MIPTPACSYFFLLFIPIIRRACVTIFNAQTHPLEQRAGYCLKSKARLRALKDELESESEGVAYIRLVQASDTLLKANSAASL